MIGRTGDGRRAIARGALVAATALLPLLGCSTDKLLKAEDPDLINPGNVNSPEGADALRIGALGRLKEMTAGQPAGNQESTWLLGGLLADEYKSGDTFTERDETDKRSVQTNNGNVSAAYRNIHRARLSAMQAIAALRTYRPANTADIAEMYMVRGFAELTAAENFCNGQPFSDASGADITYGTPKSGAEALQMALASLDTGLTTVGAASDAQSATVRNAIRTLRGRVLLGLGRFAEAGQAVGSNGSGVPTSAAYTITFAQTSGDNQLWALNISGRRFTVANRDGGNGMPFVDAADPRVPTCAGGSAECGKLPGNSTNPKTSFDQATPLTLQLLWPVRESKVTIVSGVEARLIEAESQLRGNDPGGALATLNALRANTALYPCPAATYGATNASCAAPPTPLPALVDAGTDAARQDQLFAERAFWLFGTGHRLGDLRRLVRQYGRDQASVFPNGTFFKGGSYGTDVNFPVPQSELNNPNFTVCTDRNA